MITDEYIAGFFDGEGCITSQMTFQTGKYEKYPRVYVQVTISNTNKQILEDIASIYKGTVHQKDRKGIKTCYHLRITGKENMKRFLNGILPYTCIKKEQILIALKFIDTLREENLGCTPLANNIHQIRKNIHEKLRFLKKVS